MKEKKQKNDVKMHFVVAPMIDQLNTQAVHCYLRAA